MGNFVFLPFVPFFVPTLVPTPILLFKHNTSLNNYGGVTMKRFTLKHVDSRHVQLALLIISAVMFILGSGAPGAGSGVGGG